LGDWKLLCKVREAHKASIIQHELALLDIDAVIVNKKDSAYTFMGHVEVYVSPENHEKALSVFESLEL
jgi:hypothetical protein